MPNRLLSRLLVAVLTLGGTAAGAVVTAAPATAATCPSADGVSVVADFRGVGGGVESTCVPRDGGGAAELFAAAGHSLTRVSSHPGAVCRVDGLPGDADCSRMPPPDAFWGLFWSDSSGGWHFSQEGVDSLDVPAGGSVAWAWQTGSSGYEYPGVAAPQHASSPSPSPDGDGGDGGDGSGDGTGGGHDGGDDSGAPSDGSPTTDAETGTSPTASPTTSPTPGSAGELRDRARREVRARAARRAAHEARQEQQRDPRERRCAPRCERRADDVRRRADAAADEEPDTGEPGADVVADPPPAADTTARVPTWVTVLVLLVLAGLAAVLALLRRRSARAG